MQEDMDPRKTSVGEERAASAEATISIQVHDNDPDKVVKIGSQLDPLLQKELIVFLKANLDVFAWNHLDMCGISLEVMVHKLNIDPSIHPVKQKRRM